MNLPYSCRHCKRARTCDGPQYCRGFSPILEGLRCEYDGRRNCTGCGHCGEPARQTGLNKKECKGR